MGSPISSNKGGHPVFESLQLARLVRKNSIDLNEGFQKDEAHKLRNPILFGNYLDV